jgi:activating signal cointegrator 1
LIALGEKRFETRSWQTKYRGELAIHASKVIDREACKFPPITNTLNKHGIVMVNDLPTGLIIATCQIDGCCKVADNLVGSAFLDNLELITDNEYNFGDYSEGRYAWELSNIKLLDKPIPAKGQLSLWEYPI